MATRNSDEVITAVDVSAGALMASRPPHFGKHPPVPEVPAEPSPSRTENSAGDITRTYPRVEQGTLLDTQDNGIHSVNQGLKGVLCPAACCPIPGEATQGSVPNIVEKDGQRFGQLSRTMTIAAARRVKGDSGIHSMCEESPRQSMDRSDTVDGTGSADNRQSVDMSQSVDGTKSADNRQSVDMSQSVDGTKSADKRQSVDRSQSSDGTGTADCGQSVDRPQSVVGTKSADKRQSVDMEQSVDDTKSADIIQSVNRSQSMIDAGLADKRQSVDRAQSVDGTKSADNRQSVNSQLCERAGLLATDRRRENNLEKQMTEWERSEEHSGQAAVDTSVAVVGGECELRS